MIIISTLLILAWRNAGYIGLDRWALPALGTPWHRGAAFDRGDRTTHDTRRDTSIS
jgi:thiosulfate dehydrogenase [quinone] large subunit